MMRPTEVLVLTRKRRWFMWRDLVALLLGMAVVLLVLQVGDLQHQLSRTNATRSQQFADLTDQIAQLREQLQVKDARIKQLTDQLLEHHIVPVPAPSPSPRMSPSSYRTPRPAPQPSPTKTRRPSPSPSPSPSCLIPRPAPCVTPPPMVWLLAPLPFLLNL